MTTKETAKPNYHHAPYTLDGQRDLPENVEEQPLSAGHDEEQRDRVRAADEAHTEAVKAELEAAQERADARREADADGGPLPSEFEQRQRQDLTGGKETAEDRSRREQSEKQSKSEKKG
jgi:hypothetical protein